MTLKWFQSAKFTFAKIKNFDHRNIKKKKKLLIVKNTI